MLAVPYPLDVVGTLNQSLHLVVPLVRCAAVVVFLTLNHLLERLRQAAVQVFPQDAPGPSQCEGLQLPVTEALFSFKNTSCVIGEIGYDLLLRTALPLAVLIKRGSSPPAAAFFCAADNEKNFFTFSKISR